MFSHKRCYILRVFCVQILNIPPSPSQCYKRDSDVFKNQLKLNRLMIECFKFSTQNNYSQKEEVFGILRAFYLLLSEMHTEETRKTSQLRKSTNKDKHISLAR